MLVYIVTFEQGQYTGHSEDNIAVFSTEDLARTHVLDLTKKNELDKYNYEYYHIYPFEIDYKYNLSSNKEYFGTDAKTSSDNITCLLCDEEIEKKRN